MYDIQFVATSSAGWSQAISITDANTDRPMDLTGLRVDLEVAGHFSDRELIASTATGTIEMPRPDVIQWRFTPDQMRQLRRDTTYRVGCILTTPSGPTQLFIGTLALIDGDVR